MSATTFGWTYYRRTGWKLCDRHEYIAKFRQEVDGGRVEVTIKFLARRPVLALRTICTKAYSASYVMSYAGTEVN